MADGGAPICVPAKLPLIRRNLTALEGFITLPAPCWQTGAMALVYVYFAIGLFLTLVLIFYGQLQTIRDLLAGRFRKTRCSCTNQPTDIEDTGVKAEVAEQLGVENSAVDRLEALSEARAHRSKLAIFLAEASTAQTTLGQVMMGVATICSGISLAIYLNAVSYKRSSLELCGTMSNFPQVVDFMVNIYLLAYLVIRVVGSDKRLKTMCTMHSIVDYFSIPSVLIGVLLNRYFTGFSFFRAYNFLWLVEILAYRRILKSVNASKLIKLIVLVFAIMLIAAGFLHVVENMGDPLLADPDGTTIYNGQSIAFWSCFLFVYGRITLLDLSMMRMHTMMGKIIIYGFHILALGIIGQAIPQIVSRLRIKPDHDKSYDESNTFIHVVVCGHVTAKKMDAFLEEFYHPDRDSSEFYKIVILSELVPDEDILCLQERYFSKLDYFKGTVMDMKDLNRVRLIDAKATLILSDRTAPDADADDATNIMRVVSIKNYKPNAQIIVQLSQYHNKAYLQNIPSWNPEHGDIVICLAELRLGLLAQSCLAPGFSTLMANFFTSRSFDPKKAAKNDEPWMQNYRRGTALELYCRPFSDAFDGMSFTQACEFCYSKLKIVLLAIQIDPENPHLIPEINPPPSVTIDRRKRTVGYFIADNTSQVDRAQFYCTKCHLGVDDPDLIKKCACHDPKACVLNVDPKTTILGKTIKKFNRAQSFIESEPVESKIWSYISTFDRSPKSQTKAPSLENIPLEAGADDVVLRPRPVYDSTGMFYWVPACRIEDVTIGRKEAAITHFKNHIVVCVLSQEKSQICGLSSFVLPLRSSVIKPEDLKDILLLGDPKFLEKEWKYLFNLPKIHVVKGTALNRSDLRAVNLNTCQMCVIIGAPPTDKMSDTAMTDKSVILATLNVRAMKFSDEEAVSYTPPEPIVKSKTGSPNLDAQHVPVRRRPSLMTITGYDVPVITDLMRDTNVQFLDDRDEDLPGTEFYLSQPYISGSAFTASVLDLLMVTCFFNPTIMKSIHTIVFGGASLELERIMAEGAGLIGGDNISKRAENKNQVSVQQFTVKSGPLGIHIGSPYGGLFIDALNTMALVVLGIYRPTSPGSSKRYVICNPPETFIVEEEDQIYALHRANSVLQPPLRTRLSSSHRRLVDCDVEALEQNLKSIQVDVQNMETRYHSALENALYPTPLHYASIGQDEISPLLNGGEPAVLDQERTKSTVTFAPVERKAMDDDLQGLEHRLARMKQDVAIMQERYFKFAFGDQL